MTESFFQQSTRFNKINHPHYFVEAVRKKDYLWICRHFLWQLNRYNNQPLTQKSIVATISGLTEYGGIDSRRIANTLSLMAKCGDIERYKGIANRVGWNPIVTNQVKYSRFYSEYKGNSIQTYSEDEADAILKLLKLSNSTPFMPRDLKDFEHTIKVEENEMLREEIKDLRNKLDLIEENFETFKKFCQEKFKADEVQEWFREHGLEVVKP